MNRLLHGALGAAALVVATPALAHVTLETREAGPGTRYRGVLQVNHGCAGQATTGLKVTFPEGVTGIRPVPKAGWQLSLEKAGDASGHAPAPLRSVTWSGGSLPDDEYDEFVFVGSVAQTAKAGDLLAFPVVQTCGAKVVNWTEVPAAGADAQALKEPAPLVQVAAAEATAAGPTIKAGELTIAAPWIRATPGGAKVAGGYVRITNGGATADRLVAASMPLSEHGEVHEMSMDGGIMKMRPVEGGLTIPPGGAVELKPGGYHLMFMGLNGALKSGETVKGTLTFEHAGTVPVTFRVGGFGAQQAPAMMHEH